MIPYHGTPMTPAADMVTAFKGRNAMVSYSDPRQMDVAAEICQSVIGDCGSFNAWQQGIPYDFTGYEEWAQHWIRHPAVRWFIVPDKIDGTEQENDALIAQWRLPKNVSVPVYHMHESLERLARLIDAGYAQVAIGSSGQFAEIGNPKWWGRMGEIMDVACDADGFPLTKLHGLRMLDSTVTSHLPLHTGDSCNVARNAGIDKAWNGPYAPKSRARRAQIMMDNIQDHASARRWCRKSSGVQQNMELLG